MIYTEFLKIQYKYFLFQMENKFNITLDSGTEEINESNKWVCRVCGQGFRVRSELIGHQKSFNHYLHKNLIWKCNKCNEEFNLRSELRLHMKLHIDCNEWICSTCSEKFKTRSLLINHEKNSHPDKFNEVGRRIIGFNSDDTICRYCGKEFKYNHSKTTHEMYYCTSNPDRIILPPRRISDEVRKKLSDNMKKLHSEGKSHTWDGVGKSYPEEWMTSVIESRFNDKNYVYDLKLGKYRLDFAWPKKMRYIEIDGDQHYKDAESIEYDRIRKEHNESLGWIELRFSWSYISLNKEECILAMKSFIDDMSNLPLELQYKDKRSEMAELDKKKSELRLIYPQLFNKNGNYLSTSVEEYLKRRELILNSGVDMTKSRWKSKVTKITGLRRKLIDGVIYKFPEDFKNIYSNHIKVVE